MNALVPVKGTPLENQPLVTVWEMVRMIATARILMPKTMVRLSAGRERMSVTDQALCFLAGANSIFYGEKLLTTANPEANKDMQLFKRLGIKPEQREVHRDEVGQDEVVRQAADVICLKLATCGGITLGPYRFSLSRPAAARAWSRICSSAECWSIHRFVLGSWNPPPPSSGWLRSGRAQA